MLNCKRNTLWLMFVLLLLPAKLAFSIETPNINGTWKRNFGNDRTITFRLNGNNGAIIRPNGQSIPFTIIVSERDIKVSVRILFIRMEGVVAYTLSTDQRVLNLKASESRFKALDGDYEKE